MPSCFPFNPNDNEARPSTNLTNVITPLERVKIIEDRQGPVATALIDAFVELGDILKAMDPTIDVGEWLPVSAACSIDMG